MDTENTINSPLNIERRRVSNYLGYSGRAVIIFGLWDAAKTVIQFILDPETFLQYFDGGTEIARKLAVALIVFIVMVLLTVELCIRFFIGLRAISEGQGKMKSPVYLVVTGLFLIVNTAFMIMDFISVRDGQSEPDSLLISVLIEITSDFALGMILYSACRLRFLNRRA